MNQKRLRIPGIRHLSADHVLRNRSVVGIGLGSLLSDTGHEMATAALPGYLRSIGASAAALGAIEGAADASSQPPRPSAACWLIVLALTAARSPRRLCHHRARPWRLRARQHLAVRRGRPRGVLDRPGRKAPARDSLLSGAVPEAQLGRAFGVERTMDSLGALIGPLLAAPLIVTIGYRWLFGISLIPGLFAALAVLTLVAETPRIQRATPPSHRRDA